MIDHEPTISQLHLPDLAQNTQQHANHLARDMYSYKQTQKILELLQMDTAGNIYILHTHRHLPHPMSIDFKNGIIIGYSIVRTSLKQKDTNVPKVEPSILRDIKFEIEQGDPNPDNYFIDYLIQLSEARKDIIPVLDSTSRIMRGFEESERQIALFNYGIGYSLDVFDRVFHRNRQTTTP